MRLVVALNPSVNGVTRLMIYAADGGAYLFGYTSVADGPCQFDQFYSDLAMAQEAALERFGISQSQWTAIADPLPGCQHDWIWPTRLKRDEGGKGS